MSSSQDRTLLILSTAAGLAATTALLHSYGYLTTTHKKSLVTTAGQITDRAPQAFTNLLAAFGPNGSNAPGTAAGCMIASPSRPDSRRKTENDNYFYQWPRDGGVCTRTVIRKFIQAEIGISVGAQDERAAEIERIIMDFAEMNLKVQHTPNPSGTFETGGIGEPKFLVDGSAFTRSWGRPQNDGPALRAISMLTYASYIISSRDLTSPSVIFVFDKLFSPSPPPTPSSGVGTVIRNDLDYICRAWNTDSFDPWEEVCARHTSGGHFYNLMNQRSALLAGAALALTPQINDVASATKWDAVALAIDSHLERFWNTTGLLGKEGGPAEPGVDWDDDRNLGKIPKEVLGLPHILPTLSRVGGQNKPCQVDTATLLAFIHSWDGRYEDGEYGDKWKPWGERCLASLDRLVQVFGVVYPVNKGRKVENGVLCGRYPEDVYDGIVTSIGHPWFITTHCISEILSISAHHFSLTSQIRITRYNAPLFRRFGVDVEGVIKRGDGSGLFEKALRGLRKMADGYLRTAGEFVGPGVRMDEQIERRKGTMRGARELSWSYASFLSAVDARSGVEVPRA